MAFDDTIQKEMHLGRNVQRIREIIGMKQSALADNVGMSQQNISKLESTPEIPEETLLKLAEGLGISVDFIKNFNEEKAVYFIQSQIDLKDHASANQNYYPTIHNHSDIDKVVELFEKMLQGEREKNELLAKTNELLQELLREKKGE